MIKLAARLTGMGLVLGLGLATAPAFAQDSGVANTAEDFKSADSNDGFLGSGTDIWDLFHSAGRLSGATTVDEGFYRSQSRRINRQVDSFHERQRAILQQQSVEVDAPAVEEGVITE